MCASAAVDSASPKHIIRTVRPWYDTWYQTLQGHSVFDTSLVLPLRGMETMDEGVAWTLRERLSTMHMCENKMEQVTHICVYVQPYLHPCRFTFSQPTGYIMKQAAAVLINLRRRRLNPLNRMDVCFVLWRRQIARFCLPYFGYLLMLAVWRHSINLESQTPMVAESSYCCKRSVPYERGVKAVVAGVSTAPRQVGSTAVASP